MNQNLSTALKFADLCVTLNHAEILRGVSGELRRGEITGILGPNGCCLLYTSDAADEL